MAATGTWQNEKGVGTIFGPDEIRSTWFYTPSFYPYSGPKITRVTWSFSNYENGYDSQAVDLCYIERYKTEPNLCIDVSDYNQGYVEEYFDNRDAHGSFVLRYSLKGGYYPAFWSSSTPKNLIKVDYTY